METTERVPPRCGLCRARTTVIPNRSFRPVGPPVHPAGMGKLAESTFVSLDGVIETPQNWSTPYWDDEHAGYTEKLMERTDALLLGRATYDVFAESWPS